MCFESSVGALGGKLGAMNVLCLGGRVIGSELVKVLVPACLNAEYQGGKTGGERLARRVGKIKALEG